MKQSSRREGANRLGGCSRIAGQLLGLTGGLWSLI